MKELVAYLLARQGGKAKPTKEDVKGILASVAIDADEAKLDALFKDLESLDVDAAIKEGMEKLAIIPTGGGGGAAAPAAGGAAPAAAAAAPEPESESEKSSAAGGGNMFGGDGDSDSDEDSD